MSEWFSLKATWRGLADGWNAFFHQPADGRICAALRMVFAAIVLIHLAVLYPDLERWFTAEGVLPRNLSHEILRRDSWGLFDALPDTQEAVQVAYWITVGHSVCLLVGLLPRVNAFFLFAWIASFQTRNFVITDGEDTLMRLLAFLMIWLPSGRCWSVQSLVRDWRSGASADDCRVAGWPLRLIQLEMCLVFLSSGLIKLGGEPWLNGTAMYYVSRLHDFFGRLPVPAWMFDRPWPVAVMTWAVLAAELMIPLLIWFRETRVPCLVLLVAFHLANEWTMNLFLFHWLMLCGWMAFVRAEDFSWLASPRLGWNPSPRPVDAKAP